MLAALVAAGLATVPAAAADLHGSVKDGYAAPMPPVRGPAGPCYFRADTGYSFSSEPDARWPVNNREFGGDTDRDGFVDEDEIITTYLGDRVSGTSMEGSWLAEGGFGCGTGGPRGFRGELVFGYRGSRDIDGEPLIYNPGPTPGDPVGPPPDDYDDPMHTALKTYTLMFNVYKDLGSWGGFTPYVGAGIGVAYNVVDEVYFTGNPNLIHRIEGDEELSFAWSLMAGVGYQLSDRAVLDVGYRYIDFGKANSGRIDSAGYVNPAVVLDDLTAHELKVGLRFQLGQNDCCAYMPMK
jgi:opacity protein-like surface antigen